MKFNFYNIFIYKYVRDDEGEEEQLTDKSFIKVIEHVANQAPKHRTQKIAGKYYSMPNFTHLSKSECIFWIGVFLDDKPFESSLGTNSIKQMEGDAYQPVICYYNENYKMLMVQSSIRGPKANTIKNFFENYLKDNQDYGVQFIRQKSQDGLTMINNQVEVTNVSLELKVDDLDVKDLFFRDGKDNSNNLLGDLVRKSSELAKKSQTHVIGITLKKGRYKGSLNHEIISLIQLMNNDDVSLLKGKVDIKLPSGGKKTIDLKENQYLTFEKRFGDFTGYEVLMQGLKELNDKGEIPNEAKFYLEKHLLNRFNVCHDRIDLLRIPNCVYRESEKKEDEEKGE
jgi:hypothetical protein